ncbi:MAG: hypothetical protein WCO19_05230, partial [Candidatus Saccharibacteria bacterium]
SEVKIYSIPTSEAGQRDIDVGNLEFIEASLPFEVENVASFISIRNKEKIYFYISGAESGLFYLKREKPGILHRFKKVNFQCESQDKLDSVILCHYPSSWDSMSDNERIANNFLAYEKLSGNIFVLRDRFSKSTKCIQIGRSSPSPKLKSLTVASFDPLLAQIPHRNFESRLIWDSDMQVEKPAPSRRLQNLLLIPNPFERRIFSWSPSGSPQVLPVLGGGKLKVEGNNENLSHNLLEYDISRPDFVAWFGDFMLCGSQIAMRPWHILMLPSALDRIVSHKTKFWHNHNYLS